MKRYITNYQDFRNCWKTLKQEIPLYIECMGIQCKYCGSKNIIKYGYFKNTQRWWCKNCRRKFTDNDNIPHMKTSATQIVSALGMYWEGLSVDAIRRQLYHEYNSYPSDSTIYEWIDKWWHSTLKDRAKVVRSLKDKEKAQVMLERWLIHYNFFRPQEALEGKTPAEKSGISFKRGLMIPPVKLFTQK